MSNRFADYFMYGFNCVIVMLSYPELADPLKLITALSISLSDTKTGVSKPPSKLGVSSGWLVCSLSVIML